MGKLAKIALIILITVLSIGAVIYYFLANQPAPKEKNYARILLVGDLMFDRGIRYFASQNGGNEFIFDKISDTLKNNDLVVANLEGPITNNKSVSLGTVPEGANNYYFTFDPSVAKTLFNENIKIVNLGNNHISNFGRAGLASTKNYLDKAKVGYFGASDYLPPQRDPVLGGTKSVSTQIKGIKITFIGYNEFSAVPEEVKSTVEEIKKAKGFSDIIIVYCHWGVEYGAKPTDSMKNIAHSFIDAGADLIVGSHPHVVEPMAIYKGKRIFYSLGNFIFDQYFSEDVRNGLGVVVKIDETTKQLDFETKKFYLQSNGQTIAKD